MPQGDREILKADLEDGYTKISNLILEALAMCKLNGIQKGICLFLFRRTYGWGKSEDAISLKDFAMSCGTSQPYISRQLKDLLEKKVILRVSYEPGKVPVYTFNTRVAQWDKGCIDVQGLHECAIQGLYECARVGLHECARVNQAPALEHPEIEPPVKKGLKKKKENSNTSFEDRTPYQKIVDLYHELCPSFSKVMVISENRKKHIKARWEQHKGDIEVFKIIFQKSESSGFMKGDNDRNWKADFDWMMNETNMAKILEGKYDKLGRASPQNPKNSNTNGGEEVTYENWS